MTISPLALVLVLPVALGCQWCNQRNTATIGKQANNIKSVRVSRQPLRARGSTLATFPGTHTGETHPPLPQRVQKGACAAGLQLWADGERAREPAPPRRTLC